MKALNLIKKPFGESTFSPIRYARYLGWEDAFEVEFEDDLCFLESSRTKQSVKPTGLLRAIALLR